MNNKGFTLIELLAVIVLLGVVTSITIVAVNASYKKAKEKGEEVFVSNVVKATESYIAEYKGGFEWTGFKDYHTDDIYSHYIFKEDNTGYYLLYDKYNKKDDCLRKSDFCENENYEKYGYHSCNYDNYEDYLSKSCYVKVYMTQRIPFENVINSGLMSKKEVVNPNNDNKCYNDSTVINVYKDSDQVYCYSLKLDCYDKVINTCNFSFCSGSSDDDNNCIFSAGSPQ